MGGLVVYFRFSIYTRSLLHSETHFHLSPLLLSVNSEPFGRVDQLDRVPSIHNLRSEASCVFPLRTAVYYRGFTTSAVMSVAGFCAREIQTTKCVNHYQNSCFRLLLLVYKTHFHLSPLLLSVNSEPFGRVDQLVRVPSSHNLRSKASCVFPLRTAVYYRRRQLLLMVYKIHFHLSPLLLSVNSEPFGRVDQLLLLVYKTHFYLSQLLLSVNSKPFGRVDQLGRVPSIHNLRSGASCVFPLRTAVYYREFTTSAVMSVTRFCARDIQTTKCVNHYQNPCSRLLLLGYETLS
ncbi:hypothetical protein J6590_073892 [Homalodisca vitripennis]|nr:hypothetical protein J6590_073892 [Homalodisca vitripennis]